MADGAAGVAGSAARELAAEILRLLTAAGQTVAAAESLTGGLVAAALTSVPGSSAAFRGGVVSYATDLKAALLGVPSDLLDRYGAVHPEVAGAMAEGAARRLAATFGAATTGVAGPDPADGQPVGTVYIAVSGGPGTKPDVRSLALAGNRQQIRAATAAQVLDLLLGVVREHNI